MIYTIFTVTKSPGLVDVALREQNREGEKDENKKKKKILREKGEGKARDEKEPLYFNVTLA